MWFGSESVNWHQVGSRSFHLGLSVKLCIFVILLCKSWLCLLNSSFCFCLNMYSFFYGELQPSQSFTKGKRKFVSSWQLLWNSWLSDFFFSINKDSRIDVLLDPRFTPGELRWDCFSWMAERAMSKSEKSGCLEAAVGSCVQTVIMPFSHNRLTLPSVRGWDGIPSPCHSARGCHFCQKYTSYQSILSCLGAFRGLSLSSLFPSPRH